jgi:Tfp pilus assembly protein PilP
MRPLLIALMLVAATASGQEKPAPAKVPAPAPAAPALAYTYDAQGRRDPFVSLLRGAADARRPGGKAAEGVSGFLVSEIVIKGILQSRGAFIALVLGPDNKTYTVHASDRLLDGSVRAITSDTLVLLQDVNDPLSLTRQRELRKTLRAVLEAK